MAHGAAAAIRSKIAASRSSRFSPTPVQPAPIAAPAGPSRCLNIERLARQSGGGAGHGPLGNPPQEFYSARSVPYTTGTGVEYDSGDYEKPLRGAQAIQLRRAAAPARPAAPARRAASASASPTFVEPSGGAGFEAAAVRLERTGEITVLTGSSSHGQGHETVVGADRRGDAARPAWIM